MSIESTRRDLAAAALRYAEASETRPAGTDVLEAGAMLRIAAKAYWRAMLAASKIATASTGDST